MPSWHVCDCICRHRHLILPVVFAGLCSPFARDESVCAGSRRELVVRPEGPTEGPTVIYACMHICTCKYICICILKQYIQVKDQSRGHYLPSSLCIYAWYICCPNYWNALKIALLLRAITWVCIVSGPCGSVSVVGWKSCWKSRWLAGITTRSLARCASVCVLYYLRPDALRQTPCQSMSLWIQLYMHHHSTLQTQGTGAMKDAREERVVETEGQTIMRMSKEKSSSVYRMNKEIEQFDSTGCVLKAV